MFKKDDFSLLQTLACLALQYNIVLVFNVLDIQPCDKTWNPICPEDSRLLLNTNVVFDQQGRFIAK